MNAVITMDGFTIGSIIASLVGAVIFAPVPFLINSLLNYVAVKSNYSIIVPHGQRIIISFILLMLSVGAFWSFVHFSPLFFISVVVVQAVYSYAILKPVSDVGIFRVSRHMDAGVSYRDSLKMCQTKLFFLGTSSGKLIDCGDDFVNAIARCSRNISGGTVRFLLSRPDNPLLVSAAKQYNQSPDKYVDISLKSLKRLADLKRDRDLDFEVRFYKSQHQRDFQSFRLMFINNTICIVSYNAYGKGDGSKQPQIVLKRRDEHNQVDNFYFAFDAYFDRVWNDADTWDFHEYTV